MSQVGIPAVISGKLLRKLSLSLDLIGKLDHMPHDLSWAATRNRPRIEDDHDEIQNDDRKRVREFGKKNADGQVIIDERGNVVFPDLKAEDAYLESKKKADKKEYDFTVYTCGVSVIDELKSEKYEGGYGFLDPLIGLMICNSDEETALKNAATERERLAKEAEMVSDEQKTPKKKAKS